jgi:hypothetical protein
MTRRPLTDKFYTDMTDAQLMVIFNSLGTRPGDRVKRTGLIKLSVAKFGDQILDLIKSRR